MKFVKSIFTVCSYRVYLHFDHHLTTTVQAAPQNVGKARCDNQQRAFSCFGGKCAEPTKFTFHRQSIPLCRSSPTPKARGSNPPGRTKKGRCIAVQRPFLFCHGSVLVNPSFDYVRGNIGHGRHEKTDKIAHGISFPCWFCTLGSTRAILSVFVFMGRFWVPSAKGSV